MSDQPTNFVEANALLVILAGDTAQGKALLEDLLPGELRSLEQAADALADICHVLRAEKREESRSDKQRRAAGC